MLINYIFNYLIPGNGATLIQVLYDKYSRVGGGSYHTGRGGGVLGMFE